MSISILFIHHSGVFGGASRSLLELINSFPEGAVTAHVITQKGKVPEVFRENNLDVIEGTGISQFDHTRFGFYRSLRWLILVREFAYIPCTILSILKAKYQWKNIDIVHVNEITNVLSIILVKLLFRCPLVIHVRSVQQIEKGPIRKRFVLSLLKKANAIIAIDSTVRNSLSPTLDVHTIHNVFRVKQQLQTAKKYSKDVFSSRPMKIVFVGGLFVMKGIIEFLHAAKSCAEKGLNIKFEVIGDCSKQSKGLKTLVLNQLGFSYDVVGYCRNYIKKHDLEGFIEFSGFTLDIETVYKNADLLCFPSHLNAIGRPVIEAALLKIPCVVAIDNSVEGVFIHKQTGLGVKEKDSIKLFEAVEYFYSNPTEIRRMGDAAFELALKNFDCHKNAKTVVEIYKKILI